jgi:hypothetical protein
MADIDAIVKNADALYEKKIINEDQYNKVKAMAAPEAVGAEFDAIKSKVAKPSPFDRAGSEPVSDDVIMKQAQDAVVGRASAIVNEGQRKVDMQNVQRARQIEAGAAPELAIAPQVPSTPQAVPASYTQPAEDVIRPASADELAGGPKPQANIMNAAANPYYQQINDSFDATKQLNNKLVDINNQSNKEYADIIAQQEIQKNQIKQDFEAKKLAAQAKADARLAEIEQKSLEYAEAKIDSPSEVWAKKSTEQKILAGIGMFLGAFGQKGTNQAVDVVQNAIKEDINHQKLLLAKKGESIANSKSMYKMATDAVGDINQQENAAILAGYNAVQLKLNVIAKKYEGTEYAVKAAQANAAIDLKKAEVMQSMHSSMISQAAMQGIVGPENLDEKQRERFIPGMGVAKFGTKEEVSNFRTEVNEAKIADSSLRQLIEISKVPTNSVSLEMRGKADIIVSSLQSAMRTSILGPGTVSESDRKLLEKIVANPTDVFSLGSSNRSRLEELLKQVRYKTAVKARSLGLESPQSFDEMGKAD